MRKKSMNIVFVVFSITFCFLSLLALRSDENNVPQEISPSQTVTISITLTNSDEYPAIPDGGGYLIGSKFLFEVPDQAGYTTVLIKLTSSTRSWTLTLSKIAGPWYINWDSGEPTAGEDSVPADTYTLSLTVNGAPKTCTPSEIIITNPPLDMTMIFILIGIIAGVSVGALVVVKTKKSGSKKKENELEFGTVDKTKSQKKGTVYKGASAIGKRSGQVAESKSKTSVLDRTDELEEKTHFKAIKGAFGIEKPKSAPIPSSKPTSKQMMPSDSSFQFETKVASSAAMIKSMELKMDLKDKVNFTLSKVESLLSNIEFFKAILLQQEQEELACPTCNKKAAQWWIICPYCEIQEHDSELGLQQSLMSIGGNVGFCPSCKRVIQPSWSECPYCYAKDK